MNRSDREAWASARTLADLGELTARWLEGSLASQPGYQVGCGPAPETERLIPVLVQFNRAGFMTDGSQPGSLDGGGESGQRAAVEGFAAQDVALKLIAAASRAGLHVIAYPPSMTPRWRVRYDDAVPVTRRHGDGVTWFGAARPRRDLRDFHVGYGICGPAAVAALCDAWQVTVIDVQWGRNSVLWDALSAALAVAGSEARP